MMIERGQKTRHKQKVQYFKEILEIISAEVGHQFLTVLEQIVKK